MSQAAGSLALLWRQRALVAALVVRELRSRYAGSAAGLLWTLVSPLVQITILTTVFSYVLRVSFPSRPGTPFPINLGWGLFPWLGVQEGLTRATTSLADNGVLIKRMAFPPAVVIVQPILAAALQEVIALVVLALFTPLTGGSLAVTAPLCLIPLLIQVCMSVGLGWILGVLHVYFRDTAHVVGAALQAWFYLTPIVYSLEAVPEALRSSLKLNPMTGIVETFRALALGGEIPWQALGWSIGVALAALWIGAAALSRARSDIADLV